ncbi:MAG: HD domain-containing phosphohydrolase [Pyrinomonadaceae bacterium]
MTEPKTKISLSYIVLIVLLLVGIVPVIVTGWILSDKSSNELRAAEGKYQVELVKDKANRIELFTNRYKLLVDQFSELLEFSDEPNSYESVKTQERIARKVEDDPFLYALFVKPVSGESLSAFRSDSINQHEIESISGDVLSDLDENGISVGEPHAIEKGGQLVLAFASPVRKNGETVAAVVAIASLEGLARFMEDQKSNEQKLWESGAPMVFVVDQNGRAIYHPNSSRVSSRESLNYLKIVEEWAETNNQVQTALLPFRGEFDGETRNMIGAYSTAIVSERLKFGAIVMQDENHALASVQFMRKQVWIISGIIALITVFIGIVFARFLTKPIINLADAARKISAGEFDHRISTGSITEIGVLGRSFNLMCDYLVEHIERIEQAATENRELFVGTVKALSAAIDGKDHYTRGHSERVSRVSVAIGQRMGMEAEELEILRISALLHDVGKISIDDNILKKPSQLTDEEFTVMKTHPQEGYKIMKNIPAMKEFLPGMYMHHEMVNGAGYPQGLSDKEIPLQAKIVSVADTFDAMTIDRPYQKGMDLESALERIKSFVGTRYDEGVVDALVMACEEGQIGIGTVKLRNFKRNPKTEVETNVNEFVITPTHELPPKATQNS